MIFLDQQPKRYKSPYNTSSILMCALMLFVACSDNKAVTPNSERCPHVPIDSNLVLVFYWGYDRPDNWTPNVGHPMAGVSNPLWLTPSKFLVWSGTVINGNIINGIFEITIDPITFEFVDYHAYEYPRYVDKFIPTSEGDEFILFEKSGDQQNRVVLVRLSGTTPSVEEELVGPDWRPIAVTTWPGHSGVVFSGQDPTTRETGVFWRYEEPSDGYVDSLLYIIDSGPLLISGIDIDSNGRTLFMTETVKNGAKYITSVYKYDLLTNNNSASLTGEYEGLFVGIDAHPTQPDIIVGTYYFGGDSFNPPSSFVEVLNTETSNGTKIDIRTHKQTCRFPISGISVWSPTGNHVAFPGGAADGEGHNYPQLLWVMKEVELPN